MKTATLPQAVQVLDLIRAKETPLERLQALLASGLLADLLDADPSTIKRSDFRRLCGLGPVDAKDFPTWMTLKLGVYKTAEEYLKAMKANGLQIGDWANDILEKPDFMVSSEETDIELVRLFVAELGFKKGAILSDIYAKADKLGLDPCPNEAGPALRMAYKNQPKNECVVVAMKPITDSGGRFTLFYIAHDAFGRLWLRTFSGCSADSLFVFARRKQPKA